MKLAFESRLFVRVVCNYNRGGSLLGWALLTGWREESLESMTPDDLGKEGYKGKTLDCFFDENFKGVSLQTRVLVISFILFTRT